MNLRSFGKKVICCTIAVSMITSLAGCRFGFASDPDPEHVEVKEVVIDQSIDTFTYDESLKGTKISLLNSKAEIQTALEKISVDFEEKSGIHIDVIPIADGDSPYTKIVNMYNSGNPPTMAILDTTDVKALAKEKALDLSNESWISECESYVTKIDGKVYSLPLCVEGKGIIYNQAVIEECLGRTFEPESIRTLSDFEKLLQELSENGMERPISLAKEDWSLGAHHLQYIYETYDGTSQGSDAIVEKLVSGEVKVANYDRMSQLLDAFDLLKQYNVKYGDPLGADYDEMAIDLVDGKTAFWFNGNWAWPNLLEAGADIEDAYGFLPYFMNDDETDFVNTKIQGAPSKQVMIDGEVSTDAQKQSAKQFLNWIVYSEIGQQMLVKTCNIIPPFMNNPIAPEDPLSRDIYNKLQSNQVYIATAVVPNDHWSVLGSSMQKYLVGRSDREELIGDIQNYWDEQE